MTGSTTPRHRRTHRPPAPEPAPLPPRRPVPDFRPIRRGGGGRHRLRQAACYRPGAMLTGLVVCTTAALATGSLPLSALAPRQLQYFSVRTDCPARPP
ncbi:hypothetical protein E6W39_17765 [Kitasatospora acidiphila]|uniref:Uncharacterized protein n=1 Tax=Kitasatospora acidiphila TaxID=2567942 RepID=A0A540W443_9ACTN|nr:hypothetical protein [Kitasatospora acidiphila]TQF03743.1 hypothetical protein E6W39_17765 [Kitasatospora acidiphila]